MSAIRTSTSARLAGSSRDRGADRPEERVRQLECVAPGDVEAIEESVPDEVEIRIQRRTDVTVERAQRIEHLGRVALRLEELASRRILGDRGDQPFELGGRPCGDGRRAAHHAEHLGGRHVRPIPDVREQVSDREHRRAREAHVLGDHLGVVIAATRQIRDQVLVGERVGIDRLQLAVRLDRSGLGRLIPLAELLTPELPLEDLFRALEALRDLVVGDRHRRMYAKPLTYCISIVSSSIP